MTWWLPSDPEDIRAECWLHPAATLYLESLLMPDMTVIEHGCGGSTLWLSERVNKTRSFDNDREWIANVEKNAGKNSEIVFYKDIPYISKKCDLLFIDGNNQDRPAWLMASQKLVKPGGIIVLDNAERPHYQVGRKHLLTFCHVPLTIAATTGLGKFVVTEFYRVKGGANWI
mgnify:CR=1 FL=1